VDLAARGIELHVHAAVELLVAGEEAAIEECARLGRRRGLPFVYDLGSGLLKRPYAFPASEPDAASAVAKGADLVLFSADKLLGGQAGDGGSRGGQRVRIGIQVGGGRQVKQWDPARFGDLGGTLAGRYGAQLVFTGSTEDRPLVDLALSRLPTGTDAIDLCGRVDLLTLAAILERLSVFVTGDTGPMHLAAAVGAPLVAIFGPSDPRRWGPLSNDAHIVHSLVECRPCNRIRRPPSHCLGTIPDCLAAISVDDVMRAVEQVLGQAPQAGRATATRAAAGRPMEAPDVGR